MALFESYERRIEKINSVLSQYGISSVEECREICKAAGFDNLKGHKSVGGLRASIYNAMPKEGVEALVEFLKKYEAEHA